ncbi:MAG: cell division protein ZapA [Desulfobacterales bacterium]
MFNRLWARERVDAYSLEELVTIELLGQKFTFKSDSDTVNAKEVADLLVNEVKRVETQQSGQTSNIARFAILISAALNIVNKNFELKMKHADLLKDISERSAKLIGMLDERI